MRFHTTRLFLASGIWICTWRVEKCVTRICQGCVSGNSGATGPGVFFCRFPFSRPWLYLLSLPHFPFYVIISTRTSSLCKSQNHNTELQPEELRWFALLGRMKGEIMFYCRGMRIGMRYIISYIPTSSVDLSGTATVCNFQQLRHIFCTRTWLYIPHVWAVPCVAE